MSAGGPRGRTTRRSLAGLHAGTSLLQVPARSRERGRCGLRLTATNPGHADVLMDHAMISYPDAFLRPLRRVVSGLHHLVNAEKFSAFFISSVGGGAKLGDRTTLASCPCYHQAFVFFRIFFASSFFSHNDPWITWYTASLYTPLG